MYFTWEGGVSVECYYEELGVRYYQYLKFGECSVTPKEQQWLDKISVKAQDDLLNPSRTGWRHKWRRLGDPAAFAETKMLGELHRKLTDDGECALLTWTFVLLGLLELSGTILLPVLIWRGGNHSILVAVLMAIAGLLAGAMVAIIIALPILQLYDSYHKRKIAQLLARILVFEWFYDIDVIDTGTFPNVCE